MAIRRVARQASILGPVLLAASALVGCSAGAACPSWASYATPADAADQADAVIAGQVTGKNGSVPLFGTSANVWTVRVDAWLKGSGTTEVNIVSPPESCTSPYSESSIDPFKKARGYKSAVFFLTKVNNVWQALSPIQGVVESSDGEIPESW
ncbi:hypothetical protein [Microbacterium sp. 22242]|uniref:hypothetical protein n=1 Tax=Microbacterium sp. 22242 TaxID=3453896 RepID=UPI003F82F67F